MMTNKEKAPGAAATASKATEELFEQVVPKSSEEEFITEITDFQGVCVCSMLMRGAENAITTAELRERFRCSERELRERIEQERRCGALILAVSGKGGGYFLPDIGEKGTNEMLRSYRTARAKAIGHLTSIAPVYRVLKEAGMLTAHNADQLTLDDVEREVLDG